MAATATPGHDVVKHMYECKKCHGWFYNESLKNNSSDETDGNSPHCAGSGRHVANADESNVGASMDGEAGWRVCTKCGCAYYSNSASSGTCLSNGTHAPAEGKSSTGYSTGSTIELYLKKESMVKNVTYLTIRQRCKKCGLLFRASSGDNGSCFKGTKHEAAESNVTYALS